MWGQRLARPKTSSLQMYLKLPDCLSSFYHITTLSQHSFSLCRLSFDPHTNRSLARLNQSSFQDFLKTPSLFACIQQTGVFLPSIFCLTSSFTCNFWFVQLCSLKQQLISGRQNQNRASLKLPCRTFGRRFSVLLTLYTSVIFRSNSTQLSFHRTTRQKAWVIHTYRSIKNGLQAWKNNRL